MENKARRTKTKRKYIGRKNIPGHNIGKRQKKKKTTADKSNNTTERNRSNDIGERRKTRKISGQGQRI